MNNQDLASEKDKIILILKKILVKPTTFQILEDKIEIKYEHKTILEIRYGEINKFRIVYANSYSPEQFEILEIIIKTLIQNNIKITYNEAQFSEFKNLDEIKKNENLKETDELLPKCSDANEFFYQMFNPLSKHYKKGILIYLNGDLIGALKLVPKSLTDQIFDHENTIKTFISFKFDDNKVPLQKLHIYNTDKSTYLKILKKINIKKIENETIFSRLFKRKWTKINIIGQFPLSINSRYLFKETHLYTEKSKSKKFQEKFSNLIKSVYEKNKHEKKYKAIIEL